MLPMRLYTAGIADFESVRQDGRIYVDKTDLIYKLTKESKRNLQCLGRAVA